MRFNHPNYIFLIFLAFGLLFLLVYRYRKVLHRLQGLGDRLYPKIIPGFRPSFLLFSGLCLFLTAVFLIVTLMEPQWGTKEEIVKRRGIDLLILVDVSESMLAQDISPNRLEHLRRKLKDLLDMLQGDRAGLILFAGRAILQSPLTTDYGALRLFVDELSPKSLSVQGTDFKGALELAGRVFEEKGRNKAILLFTDGEDHSAGLEATLLKLKEESIRLYVMGIGTQEGAPVPLPDGGFKMDRSGNMVVSRLNEAHLQEIALKTGGAYVRSLIARADLEELYLKGIRRELEASEIASSKKKLWVSRYRYPLALAGFFFGLERVLALLAGRKRL